MFVRTLVVVTTLWIVAVPCDAAELSLATLYRPGAKIDFETRLPEFRWVADDPDAGALLVVRREHGWQQMDLDSGDETPWPYPLTLADRIAAIEGIDPNLVAGAVDDVVMSMTSPSHWTLLTLDQSLYLIPPEGPVRLLTHDASTWQDAALDDSGRRIAYTRQGDLYVIDVASGRSTRLTDDGSDTLLDGRLDWTYQEEIFGRGNFKGFWFSRDGNFLAMFRTDIAAIPPYVLPDSTGPRGAGQTARYSKAGDPIPHVSFYLYDLRPLVQGDAPRVRLIDQSTAEDPRIITGVWWHPHRFQLLYTITDRRQTWRELRYVDGSFIDDPLQLPRTWIREEGVAWVDPPATPGFLKDGGLIWPSELPAGRMRLHWLMADAKTITPLTPPDLHVRSFAFHQNKALWIGHADNDTTSQHAYLANLETAFAAIPDPTPLTSGRGWNEFSPSPNLSHVVVRSSNADQPPVLTLRPTTPAATPRQEITIAEVESEVPGPWTPVQVFRIPAADGFPLPAKLIRAPAASERSPGPVVVEVYGGPSAPLVADRWSERRGVYHQWLARQGISTLQIDNRSSGGRGPVDTWAVHRRLGEVELADTLAAADYLKRQDWVDPQRMGIRGWSFGGFLTLHVMTHSDVFAAGIAGGSVTDWREYDSFYTERFMGLPEDNPDGYRDLSPLRAADRISGRVLLVHGEADDNVHPANTLRMAAALQNAGKAFDLMIYPGAGHGITDPDLVWHLEQMIDEFWRDHLLDPPESGAEKSGR